MFESEENHSTRVVTGITSSMNLQASSGYPSPKMEVRDASRIQAYQMDSTITPVTSPEPSGVPSPEPSGVSSPEPDVVVTSPSQETPENFASPSESTREPSSLPSSYLNCIPRDLTPRTDPHGYPSNGVLMLANKFILFEPTEGNALTRCISIETEEQYCCKIITNDVAGRGMLAAHYRVDGHQYINKISHVVSSEKQTYLLFPPSSVDLHTFVRNRRRLREPQARPLFKQIVSALHEVHSKGIILRDLKLRKFVFTDDSGTELKLESLDDAVTLDNVDDDLLSEKHGCPAYVSPEILKADSKYSGRAADMWGLGVMLYTMLIGRYPFHGQEHSNLFAKIRRGHFNLPDSLSTRAKCLIRCLLRKEPSKRLSAEDVLNHPWVTQPCARERYRRPNPPPSLSSSSTTTQTLGTTTNGQGIAPGAAPSTVLIGSSSFLSNSNSEYDQQVPECFNVDFNDVFKN